MEEVFKRNEFQRYAIFNPAILTFCSKCKNVELNFKNKIKEEFNNRKFIYRKGCFNPCLVFSDCGTGLLLRNACSLVQQELTGSNPLPRRSSTLAKTRGTATTKRRKRSCAKSRTRALPTSRWLKATPPTCGAPSSSRSRGWTASWRSRGPRTRGLLATPRLSWHPGARRPRTLDQHSTTNSGLSFCNLLPQHQKCPSMHMENLTWVIFHGPNLYFQKLWNQCNGSQTYKADRI